MLRSLRDGAKSGFLKFILLGFMAMAVGGLVLTDVGGFFRGGISSNLVAKGKGIEITAQQFDRTVRRIMARQGMSSQEAYRLGMINQILNSEVQVRLMAVEARKMGLYVDDATVTRQIAQLAEPLATGGVTKADALKQVLRSQGISEGEFIQSIRQEMGTTLLRNALVGGATQISKAQATALYEFDNESRHVRAISFNNKDVKDITAPTDENLQKFYDTNKAEFAIAERRDITIATLKKEMLSDKVEITDQELRDIYADNVVQYQNPEKRTVEQAILSTQADAQKTMDALNEGKSLKAAVQKTTGNATAYLGENNFEQGGLLEEIADPVFAADTKKGAEIGPIQTALGWHVLVVKDILPPETESYDSVKAGIRDNLLQNRLIDDLLDAANTLDDQLAGGEELEVVVNEMGLTTEEFKDLDQAGLNKAKKDLFKGYQGDKAQILEAAFDYDADEASPVLELADGTFITVRVDEVTPLSYQSYASVKAKLKTRWINQQKALSNRARADDAFAMISSGKSLNDVAKEYGARIRNYKNLKRSGEAKAPFTALTQRQVFNAALNTPEKLASENGYLLAEVTSINLPATNKADQAITKIQSDAGTAMPQEILEQYINALSTRHKIKINNRVLEAMYGTANNG